MISHPFSPTGVRHSGSEVVTARRRRLTASVIAQYTVLCATILLAFIPLLIMLSMSLRPTVLIYADFWALPFPPVFENYQTAILDLVPPLLRTLHVCFTSIIGRLVIAAPAAYAFARLRFVFRDQLFYLILAVMMIPGAVLLTPHFILANQLHLRGSLEGLIIFYVAGGQPFAIFLLTTFFKSQSEEIFEAARVDGAGEIQALISIAVPLARPILVTIAIMGFLGIYDDLIWPSLMLPQSLNTLILALQKYNPQIAEFLNRPNLGAQTAGFVFATVPQLILFALGMKYFIQGLTSGSVKA